MLAILGGGVERGGHERGIGPREEGLYLHASRGVVHGRVSVL